LEERKKGRGGHYVNSEDQLKQKKELEQPNGGANNRGIKTDVHKGIPKGEKEQFEEKKVGFGACL